MVANEEVLCHHKGKVASDSLSCSCRPPSVVTSTAFDDDNVFQTVARAMMFRHEVERLSEREAINASLVTAEDKRAFLESLDLRSANLYMNFEETELENSAINEVVEMTRSMFGETLKLLWRESITGYDSQSSGILSQGGDIVDDDDNTGYRQRLKTPKNYLHSPIRVAMADTTCGKQNNENSSIKPKRSGRERRQFFPDTEPRCRARIRLDFKLATVLGRAGEEVKTLQFDGQPVPSMIGYAPPSPISTAARRVCVPDRT